MKRIAYLLILVLLVVACNQGKPTTMNMELSDKISIPPPPPPAEEQGGSTIHKTKLIKDGRMEIEVTDLEKTKTLIDSLVKRLGGYYANESLSNYGTRSSYTLKIRMPSDYMDQFIKEIESGNGKIIYKNIDIRDVTEEFIDLETRLENKRGYLKRYNELLKQTKTIKDILEIEEKTRVIEEEIESTEGRLKYLNDLVDFSTLELTLTREDYNFTSLKQGHFWDRLKQSFSKGWYSFVDFVLFLLKLWPFWILLAIIIPLWSRYKTRKKARDKLKN